MPPTPDYLYFIGQGDPSLTDQDPRWHAPLPVSRHPSVEDSSRGNRFTYGDYFTGARSFLAGNQHHAVIAGMKKLAPDGAPQRPIRRITIRLMKHGAHYHPARIRVEAGNETRLFALNAAVSHPGLRIIDEETTALARISRSFPYAYTPVVLARGGVCFDGAHRMEMFLANWFEGFKEFHLSVNPTSRKAEIVVWDEENGPYFLDGGSVQALYAETSKILTGYFNVASFEHVAAWHHAAGDFIIDDSGGALSARLIAVRSYKPIFEIQHPDLGDMLDALFVFLLTLSIRMRIDRENGVGDFLWADDRALSGIVRGFFQGLEMQSRHGLIPEAIIRAFSNYLLAFTAADLLTWITDITDRMYGHVPEAPLIRKHLREHVSALHVEIRRQRQ